MSTDHGGHVLKYVMDASIVERDCRIVDGDVVTSGEWVPVHVDGDAFIYCDTCDTRLHAGDGGLSPEWVVVESGAS